MTVADMLREQGRQEGHQEGLEEGRRTMLRMFLQQLRARFGGLPEAVVTRVNAADVAQLERWAASVLTAPTLADVLGET